MWNPLNSLPTMKNKPKGFSGYSNSGRKEASNLKEMATLEEMKKLVFKMDLLKLNKAFKIKRSCSLKTFFNKIWSNSSSDLIGWIWDNLWKDKVFSKLDLIDNSVESLVIDRAILESVLVHEVGSKVLDLLSGLAELDIVQDQRGVETFNSVGVLRVVQVQFIDSLLVVGQLELVSAWNRCVKVDSVVWRLSLVVHERRLQIVSGESIHLRRVQGVHMTGDTFSRLSFKVDVINT
ncbi:hypothetical protein WICPIJ_007842 [Wickerhamomyces pijperi]|uniref:Uncharacterized protein n=1 Tax=Wickerhamomyces pijperi TaxID=599730 RepID=A0A9P8Q0X7_WICPI|nr:hypothetical protein WICPIJ_007842 [Wickerhamomyces pijperi]